MRRGDPSCLKALRDLLGEPNADRIGELRVLHDARLEPRERLTLASSQPCRALASPGGCLLGRVVLARLPVGVPIRSHQVALAQYALGIVGLSKGLERRRTCRRGRGNVEYREGAKEAP